MADPQGPRAREDAPRRTLIGAGLLTAVLAAVAMASLLSGPAPSNESRAERTRPPEPTRVGQADPFTEVVTVEFAEEQHGFAVLNTCKAGRCRNALLVTTDGVRWTQRGYPALAVGVRAQYLGALSVLGDCRVSLDDPKPYNALSRDHLFSDDCGQNWRHVPAKPSGSVERIPDGATIAVACPIRGRSPDVCPARVEVTDPATGTRSWLAEAPRLRQARTEPVPQRDGGWWLTGRHPSTNRWTVAVSHDDGVNWTVSTLRAVDLDVLTPVVGPDDAYLLGWGPVGYQEVALTAVFHSTDGGRTWRRTGRFDGDSDQPGIPTAGVVRPQDLLLVTSDPEGRYWASSDDGRSFRPVGIRERLMAPRWTRGGYVAFAPHAHGPRWYHSPDGSQWRELWFPEG